MSKKGTVYLLKIGSFIDPFIGDTSSIGLITGEPVNFARLLKKIGYDVKLASNMSITSGGLDYFNLKDNFESVAKGVNPEDAVLIWQGGYYDKEHEPLCVRHYQFLKIVQDQKRTEKQLFMLTDTRLPMMNFGKYIKEAYTDDEIRSFDYSIDDISIDDSQVTVLAQATKVDEMKLDFETDIFYLKGRYDGNAYTNYKDIVHLPMYAMPLITHGFKDTFSINYSGTPKHDLVFTVQSIEYFDEYRISRLHELMLKNKSLINNYDLAIYGKHSRKALNTIFDYIEKNDGESHIQLPTMMKPVNFHEMKHTLRSSVANLCISEKPYVKYDLVPNRIFESFATGCIPIIDLDIIKDTNLDILRRYEAEFDFVAKDADDVEYILKKIKQSSIRTNSNIILSGMSDYLIEELIKGINKLF